MAAKMTYEQAMKRMEEIVTLLNDGSLPLEESVKLFEEGTKLTAICNKYLEKTALKISELSQKQED